jgi:SET domain-containing protein
LHIMLFTLEALLQGDEKNWNGRMDWKEKKRKFCFLKRKLVFFSQVEVLLLRCFVRWIYK